MLDSIASLEMFNAVGKPTAERKAQVSNLPGMNLPLLYI